MTASSGYRAVAPDIKSSQDAAERRRQLIQESKFLGGKFILEKYVFLSLLSSKDRGRKRGW